MKKLEEMNLEEKIEYYELLSKENEAKLRLKAQEGEINRARSHSVGAGPGGVVELSLRTNDGKVVWTVLQPVEVSELIHTMASAIGCYAALKPREDFSAWRNWHLSSEERERLFMDPQSYVKLTTNGQVGLENNKAGTLINNTKETPGLTVQEE